MLPQAQNPLLTATIPLDTPVGALLTIALLALLAVGIAVESGLTNVLHDRLVGTSRTGRRMATAGHGG